MVLCAFYARFKCECATTPYLVNVIAIAHYAHCDIVNTKNTQLQIWTKCIFSRCFSMYKYIVYTVRKCIFRVALREFVVIPRCSNFPYRLAFTLVLQWCCGLSAQLADFGECAATRLLCCIVCNPRIRVFHRCAFAVIDCPEWVYSKYIQCLL